MLDYSRRLEGSYTKKHSYSKAQNNKNILSEHHNT